MTTEDLVHDSLVNIQRVLRRLGKERLVRHVFDGRILWRVGCRYGLDEIALGQKVATKLLLGLGGYGSGGTVGL